MEENTPVLKGRKARFVPFGDNKTIEKIDAVLFCIAANADLGQICKWDSIAKYLLENHLNTNNLEIGSILEKLISDNYVKFHDGKTPIQIKGENGEMVDVYPECGYSITINGIMFQKRDGYRGLENLKISENTRLANLENHQSAHRTWMTWLTAILALFAFLSVFLQSLEKFHILFRIDIWAAFFLYVSGILTGTATLLIAKEVLSRKNNKKNT